MYHINELLKKGKKFEIDKITIQDFVNYLKQEIKNTNILGVSERYPSLYSKPFIDGISYKIPYKNLELFQELSNRDLEMMGRWIINSSDDIEIKEGGFTIVFDKIDCEITFVEKTEYTINYFEVEEAIEVSKNPLCVKISEFVPKTSIELFPIKLLEIDKKYIIKKIGLDSLNQEENYLLCTNSKIEKDIFKNHFKNIDVVSKNFRSDTKKFICYTNSWKGMKCADNFNFFEIEFL